jgi:hypothetical protein
MIASNRYPVSGGNAESVVPLAFDGSGILRPSSFTNPLPVQVIGSGVVAGATDLLYTDDTGAQFVYRDDGSIPPVFTAYLIPAGTPYTVGTHPRPFYSQNVVTTDSVIASDSIDLPIDSLAHTLTPAAPPDTGTQTDAVSYGGHTYTQTLTFSGGSLASWSDWVMS